MKLSNSPRAKPASGRAPSPVFFERPRVGRRLGPALSPGLLRSPQTNRGERSAERRGGLRGLLGGWRSRPARLRGVPLPPCDRRKGASRRSTGGVFLPAPGRALPADRFVSASGSQAAPPFGSSALLRALRRTSMRSAVSQLLAGVRSDPGRSPGAARVRGYEPRPRAPRQPFPGCPVSAREGLWPHLRPSALPLLRLRHVSGRRPSKSKVRGGYRKISGASI